MTKRERELIQAIRNLCQCLTVRPDDMPGIEQAYESTFEIIVDGPIPDELQELADLTLDCRRHFCSFCQNPDSYSDADQPLLDGDIPLYELTEKLVEQFDKIYAYLSIEDRNLLHSRQ